LSQLNQYLRLRHKPSQKELEKLGFYNAKELKWFEEEVLEYLIFYFQKGFFLNKILKNSNLDIPRNSIKELIEFSFLKFVSRQEIKFSNYLSKWTRQIRITSIENPIILNNHIEGKILWKETFKERNYLDYPQSIKFVCNSYKNSFDSTENCLIKSFLIYLKDLIEYNLKPYLKKKLKKDDWRYHAVLIHNSIIKIINNFYMQEVTLKKNLWKDSVSLSITLKSCYRNNHFILSLANLLNDLKTLRNKELIKLFLIDQIIKPNENKTAELYVLFTIIKKLSEIPNGSEEFYTIKQKNLTDTNYIYAKSFDNKEVKVYYQLGPKWAKIKNLENSLYAKTLKSYGLRNISLHPDVLLEIRNGKNRKIIIIEVKNSKEPQYLRKGLHQLCNYHKLLKLEEGFKDKSYILNKIGILIVKEIPEKWTSEDQEGPKEIKVLDFKQLKELNLKSILQTS